MEAIKLEFQPNLKSKILAGLSSFSSDELKIVHEDSDFENNKQMLDFAYSKIKDKTAKLYTLEEIDSYLDKVISEYEN